MNGGLRTEIDFNIIKKITPSRCNTNARDAFDLLTFQLAIKIHSIKAMTT